MTSFGSSELINIVKLSNDLITTQIRSSIKVYIYKINTSKNRNKKYINKKKNTKDFNKSDEPIK